MVANHDDAEPHLERSSAVSLSNEIPDALRSALAERYGLDHVLGRGASAVVYLARDRVRATLVAIKVLHDEVSPAASAARFQREVEIEQRLEHVNIVPVLDTGSAAGRPYYTMPYFEGQTLREKLQRERQLSIEETLAIAAQIAAALDYAHSRGIVHRDIKPANVLMTPEGVRVADFGIARAMIIASGESMTGSGFTVGTPEYMSPEQAAGQREIDGRSDIYALGCVVYQMLSGEPPFTGATAQAVIARHFQEAPRSLRVIRPSVPPHMQAAIERALSKVPADRQQTAGRLIADLVAPAMVTPIPAEASLGENIGSSSASLPPLAHRYRARARVLQTLALTSLVAGVGGYAAGAKFLTQAGTDSFRAARAFTTGSKALADGSFAQADTAFRIAVAADPEYREALIWSALVRWWLDAKAIPTRGAMSIAAAPAAGRRALSDTDKILLQGLVGLSQNRVQNPCEAWSAAPAGIQQNPFVLFALGTCLQRDAVVLPDTTSPSGWRFRSSYEAALVAFERAFEQRPALIAGVSSRSASNAQDLFRTSGARMREGRSLQSNSIDYYAYPELLGDTLGYVPYPGQTLLASAAPNSFAAAIQHQRVRLLSLARAWVERDPRSPVASRLLAISLDLLGDAEAPEAFQKARALASSESERLNIAAEAALVRIKYAIPDDTAALRSAIRTVDSLLRANPPSERREMRLLGALAALIGKGHLAAQYAANGGVDGAVHELTGSGPALLTYASVGGPPDSIRKYETLTETAVAALPIADANRSRQQWIWRAAALAYPEYRMRAISDRDAVRGSVLEATTAAAMTDTVSVRTIIRNVDAARKFRRPSDMMVDVLYTENRALIDVGEFAAANLRSQPTLQSLRFASTMDLGQIPKTGTLVRLMALYAASEARLGNAKEARRWANAVALLWADADEFQRLRVRELKVLVP